MRNKWLKVERRRTDKLFSFSACLFVFNPPYTPCG